MLLNNHKIKINLESISQHSVMSPFSNWDIQAIKRLNSIDF